MRARRLLRLLALLGVLGALCLPLLSGSLATTTDASWADAQTARAQFSYPSRGPGLPDLNSPEEIDRHLRERDAVTPEVVEELLEQATPEQARTIIDTVGRHQNRPVIEHVNELGGLRPRTPEGIGADGDGIEHVDNNGTHRSFCYDLDVYNFTDQPQMWEMTFDTSASPFWGWEPFTNGQPNFSGNTQRNQGYWESHRWDSQAQEWTVRGTVDPTGNQWWRAPDSSPIPAGTPQNPGSVNVRMCMNNVPGPVTQHGLFTYDVYEVQGNAWYQELGVAARTDVETYIPWEFYVDLTQHVCPATLSDPRVQISVGARASDQNNWVLQPLAGSSFSAETPYLFRVTRSPQAPDFLIRRLATWDGQQTVYPRWNRTFLRLQATQNAQIQRPSAAGTC